MDKKNATELKFKRQVESGFLSVSYNLQVSPGCSNYKILNLDPGSVLSNNNCLLPISGKLSLVNNKELLNEPAEKYLKLILNEFDKTWNVWSE